MDPEASRSLPGEEVPRRIRCALLVLFEAYRYAEDLKRDKWDFAVEIASLRKMGLTSNDLRWLIFKGCVDNAREITMAGQGKREFRFTGGLKLSKRTCFVLTDSGVLAAEKLHAETTASSNGESEEAAADRRRRLVHPSVSAGVGKNGAEDEAQPRVPKWDCDRHELRVDGVLVKIFKVPSPNQETILTAFEEEGWPPRIDDPLPPHPELVPTRRLHETIKSLNRSQKQRLIRFLGDGTGEGIRWEFMGEEHEKRPFPSDSNADEYTRGRR